MKAEKTQEKVINASEKPFLEKKRIHLKTEKYGHKSSLS
tara:strand:+ start:315 stop:431 length:117 start_codon:yes stop_codon:yes gene_type:complete